MDIEALQTLRELRTRTARVTYKLRIIAVHLYKASKALNPHTVSLENPMIHCPLIVTRNRLPIGDRPRFHFTSSKRTTFSSSTHPPLRASTSPNWRTFTTRPVPNSRNCCIPSTSTSPTTSGSQKMNTSPSKANLYVNWVPSRLEHSGPP